MDAEKQRIAIAEACGWRFITGDTSKEWVAEHEDHWRSPTAFSRHGHPPASMWYGPAGRALPDYLTDLNAMHEAENVLDVMNGGPSSGDCLRYAYSATLYRLCPDWVQPFRAPAMMRAEAFLRTLGKWID
jgi:hypothetical protein